MSDDMDIMLCILDIKTNMLTYSGVRNPLYLVRDRVINELRAAILPVNGSVNLEGQLGSSSIQLVTGDTIYLCSDGYIDQFGGKNHKKYQSTRFKSFLLGIQGSSMSEQSDLLYEETEKWREENTEDQTDDILVIGIRI
jgi:serine phosphatase RsbU (regulator of sigma subunit)